MFNSAYSEYDKNENTDSVSDSITTLFTEATEIEGDRDSYVPKGYETPEQQIASIQRDLDSGAIDLNRLESMIRKMLNVSREGIPTSLQNEFDQILDSTSYMAGSMGKHNLSQEMSSNMAELGITPKQIEPAPTIQTIAPPMPA